MQRRNQPQSATQTPNRTCVGFSVTIVRKICTGTGRRERKVVSSSQDGHGFVSRALPAAAGRGGKGVGRSLCYGFQSLDEMARPLNCVPPTTSVSPIRYSAAVKTGGWLLVELSRPRIVRMPGRISRDTTNLDPHSVHVAAPRRQGRTDGSSFLVASRSPRCHFVISQIRWRVGEREREGSRRSF